MTTVYIGISDNNYNYEIIFGAIKSDMHYDAIMISLTLLVLLHAYFDRQMQ